MSSAISRMFGAWPFLKVSSLLMLISLVMVSDMYTGNRIMRDFSAMALEIA